MNSPVSKTNTPPWLDVHHLTSQVVGAVTVDKTQIITFQRKGLVP